MKSKRLHSISADKILCPKKDTNQKNIINLHSRFEIKENPFPSLSYNYQMKKLSTMNKHTPKIKE